MDFTILRRNTLFEGPAFNIDRVAVRLPDGREANYDVVSHQGAVTLVPLDQSGNIWFVRQYRTATAQYLLELPAGTLSPDEPTAECAQRELREEIGLAAGKLLKLGDFYLAPGYSNEYMHVYLATELTPDPLPGDADEFLQPVCLPVSQVYEMARQGLIRDGKTLAALLLAQPHLPQA